MEQEKRGNSKWIVGFLILIILGVAAFIYLNSKEKKVETPVVTTPVISTNTPIVVDIIALGNEPGWRLDLSGEASKAEANLIVDYAESTFTGILGRSWQENYDNEFQFRGSLTPTASSSIKESKDFIAYFKKEVCTDDAGKEHAYSANINMHSEKEYKGCADVK